MMTWRYCPQRFVGFGRACRGRAFRLQVLGGDGPSSGQVFGHHPETSKPTYAASALRVPRHPPLLKIFVGA